MACRRACRPSGDEVFQIASGTSTVTELGYLSSYQTDGGGFAGGLVADSAGNLYGTTIYGGGGDGGANGVLFEIDAATHTLTPLASSSTNSPGSAPVIDSKGDLFFVDGGNEIDELAAGSHTFTTFATVDVRGPLTIDSAGNIYGQNGAGAYGYGSVFEISAQTGAVKTLIDFNGANGEESSGGLVLDAAGDLFGNAHNLFEIQAGTQTESILAEFADGGLSETNQITLDAAGDIIGTTTPTQGSPDGSVYELAVGSNVVTTLIADAQGVAGLTSSPQGELYGSSSDAVYEIALCYCPGTLILTPVGEVAVEMLTIGGMVVTASGLHKPIRWIGRRSYAGAFVAGQHLMLPICFKRGSLADNIPHTDLWVSPGHAMFVDGQLVPAWRLINGVSVVQAEAVDTVTYIHIELGRHDILLANGAEAESFLDDDCRGQFHNAAEFYAHYPDAVPMVPFAPRLEDGFGLQRLQERIALRAGVFSTTRTNWPAARLCRRRRTRSRFWVGTGRGEPGGAGGAGSAGQWAARVLRPGEWLPRGSTACRYGFGLPCLRHAAASWMDNRPNIRSASN